jgi:hypothetical protein
MKRGPMYRAFRKSSHAILVVVTVGVLSAAFTEGAFAAEKSFVCTPIEVGVFPKKRIHVKCSPGDGAISYLALGVADAGEANRTLSILSTAFAVKKRLTIWSDPADTTGTGIGCQTNNCRLIRGVRMF